MTILGHPDVERWMKDRIGAHDKNNKILRFGYNVLDLRFNIFCKSQREGSLIISWFNRMTVWIITGRCVKKTVRCITTHTLFKWFFSLWADFLPIFLFWQILMSFWEFHNTAHLMLTSTDFSHRCTLYF